MSDTQTIFLIIAVALQVWMFCTWYVFNTTYTGLKKSEVILLGIFIIPLTLYMLLEDAVQAIVKYAKRRLKKSSVP